MIIFISTTLSCFNNNNLGHRKNCNCSLREFANTYSDTTWINDEKKPFSVEAELKIKGMIGKLVDAELSASITNEEKTAEYRKILTSVYNNFPEHENLILFFRLKRLIYCEYYERICKNTDITNEDMDIRLEKKITELDTLINNYFESYLSQPQSDPSPNDRDPKISPKIKNKCLIFSEKKAVGYSKNFNSLFSYLLKYGIVISYSLDGFAETKYSGRYFYNGGYATIRIDNKDILLSEFKLQPQYRQGNPKNIVEEAIRDNIVESINKNRQTFEVLVKNVICK